MSRRDKIQCISVKMMGSPNLDKKCIACAAPVETKKAFIQRYDAKKNQIIVFCDFECIKSFDLNKK